MVNYGKQKIENWDKLSPEEKEKYFVRPYCSCGCGQQCKIGRRFVYGHGPKNHKKLRLRPSEKIAYDYLVNLYPGEKISFQRFASPDFLIKSKNCGYEAKLLKNNAIIFHCQQWETLDKLQSEMSIWIIVIDNRKPICYTLEELLKTNIKIYKR